MNRAVDFKTVAPTNTHDLVANGRTGTVGWFLLVDSSIAFACDLLELEVVVAEMRWTRSALKCGFLPLASAQRAFCLRARVRTPDDDLRGLLALRPSFADQSRHKARAPPVPP